jgi:ribosomal protein S6
MSESQTSRVYELGYLLLPTLTDADRDTAIDAMIAIITDKGGVVLSQGAPEALQLAYTMVKVIDNKKIPFESASFGWIKFEAEGGVVEEVKTSVEATPSMLRALLTQTLKDDTLTNKRPAVQAMEEAEKLAREVKNETAKPVKVVKEVVDTELDKNIDKLVEEVTNADDSKVDA